MKRSTKIGLGAVGVVLVASAWSYLGGEDDKLVYNDTTACRADGKLSHDQCEQRYQEAKVAHQRNARRFGAQSSCEAEFGTGRCEMVGGVNGQMWAPALVGFMVARHLAGAGGGVAQPLLAPTRQQCRPGSPAEECRPAARTGGGSTGGSSYGSSGRRAYSTTDGGSVTAGGMGSTKVGVTSRGGFGSSGHGVSSGS